VEVGPEAGPTSSHTEVSLDTLETQWTLKDLRPSTTYKYVCSFSWEASCLYSLQWIVFGSGKDLCYVLFRGCCCKFNGRFVLHMSSLYYTYSGIELGLILEYCEYV